MVASQFLCIDYTVYSRKERSRATGILLSFLPSGAATVIILIILFLLCFFICVFLYHRPLGLKSRVKKWIQDLDVCCAHEGRIGTDESAQALTQTRCGFQHSSFNHSIFVHATGLPKLSANRQFCVGGPVAVSLLAQATQIVSALSAVTAHKDYSSLDNIKIT